MPRPKGMKIRQKLENARKIMLEKKQLHISLDENEVGLAFETTTLPEQIDLVGSSHSKIDRFNDGATIEGGCQTWTILNILQLNNLMSELLCPNCIKSTLSASIIEKEHLGFASKINLSCPCGYKKYDYSSPRFQNSLSANVAFEINTKMVLYSHEIGQGFQSLQKFSSVIGIPGMTLQAFQDQDKKVTAHEVESGEDLLERTAGVIRQAHAEIDDDLRMAIERGEQPLIDISVSYDGTWQKRGFTSLYKVGACIDLLTGLVVDFDIRSKYCHSCKLKNAHALSKEDFMAWQQQHDCCYNHNRSSKSMEQDSAVILWQRSIEKFNFRYVEMLSDGDSSTFKAVCDSKPYGETAVSKLDCLNHAHKRMGTALRKLSKDSHLGGKGLGKLTGSKCDNLQNFYRGAILDNLDNVGNMKNAIWAALYHSMSTDSEHHHRHCPAGHNSWCWYQQALSSGVTPGSHKDHKSSTYLSLDVAHKMFPIYRRMSDENLLQRMVHGRTQNSNESFNALIWARSPKTSFMGVRRVKGCVARAVATFNAGATEIVQLMTKLDLSISNVSIENFRKINEKRIKRSDSARTTEARKRRKALSMEKFKKVRNEAENDGDVYGAGAF